MTSPYQLLKKYQPHPRKSLGQNFLVDANHLQKIVDVAQVTADDIVLEVGPGLGFLTTLLLDTAKSVVAVEIDQRMVDILSAEITAANFHLHHTDILKVDPAAVLKTSLPTFSPTDAYIVVANLPYYITSAIIRHFLEAPHPPRSLIITIQKEVAQRIVAQPGQLSLLAISVQFYGQPTLCHAIPPNAFIPPPNVTSAVLRIDRHLTPPVTIADPDVYFRMVKIGFSQKRKQLKNTLAAGLQRPQAEIADLLQQVGIAPTRRAQTLTLEEWALVVEQLREDG